MSGHLIGCVKPIKTLPKSHKLALMAFADSGDDRTHIALPGYEGVMEWAGVGRTRAAELIRDLTAWGFLRQHKRGHRGQRAEWIVFPDGCCETHRAPQPEEPVDVDELARAAGVDVDQVRLLLTAMGHDAPPSGKGSAPGGPNERGKRPPQDLDPTTHDPQPGENAGENGSDEDRQRPESVRDPRVTPDAVTPSGTSPLPPETGGCRRHRKQHPNCRGCGTTDRQKAERAAKAAAERRRQRSAQEAAAARQQRLGAAPPPEGLRGIVAAAAAEEQRRNAERAAGISR